MAGKTRLEILFEKFLGREISPQELEELLLRMQDADAESLLDPQMRQAWDRMKDEKTVYARDWEKIYSQVINTPAIRPAPKRIWSRIAIAASILLLISLGIYTLVNLQKQPGKPQIVKTPDIQAPESNRAMITLGNGQNIYLDELANGNLAREGNVELVKLADGQIQYSGTNPEIIYNTLNNPRGSKVINITLADGSRVWLNAGSSITYPVAFSGKERKVSMEGEAYYEISHDPSKPFYVSKDQVNVKVLGTHFNINAYEDEAEIKVTLLEGKVEVNKGQESITLKSGEQAVSSPNSPLTTHHPPDLEQTMSWKSGWFDFENTDLQTILRQVSRWYDVTVSYEGKTGSKKYWGRLSRELPLSDILAMLKNYGVEYKFENRMIRVIRQAE